MHKHRAHPGPNHDPQRPRASSRRYHGTRRRADDVFPPPWPSNPDGPVPFMMFRGRWLAQMGFVVGCQIKVHATEGQFTVTLLGPPRPLTPQVPTTLEREVHYTEVEPHTHITHPERTP